MKDYLIKIIRKEMTESLFLITMKEWDVTLSIEVRRWVKENNYKFLIISETTYKVPTMVVKTTEEVIGHLKKSYSWVDNVEEMVDEEVKLVY